MADQKIADQPVKWVRLANDREAHGGLLNRVFIPLLVALLGLRRIVLDTPATKVGTTLTLYIAFIRQPVIRVFHDEMARLKMPWVTMHLLSKCVNYFPTHPWTWVWWLVYQLRH